MRYLFPCIFIDFIQCYQRRNGAACAKHWKHCGVVTCTFCFDRSFASYEGLTLNGKKKVDCIVNNADLILPMGSHKKVDFNCDVCLNPFSMTLSNLPAVNGAAHAKIKPNSWF
jgi:hypothetical protein